MEHFETFQSSMALIRAIHNLAKLYHWKSTGTDFYQDHLFFDRIADTFNEDLVDKIAENYFMIHTQYIDKLDDLDQMVATYTQPHLYASDASRFQALYDMCEKLVELTKNSFSDESVSEDRSINVLLDEITITATGMLGLLHGRLVVEIEAQTSINGELANTMLLNSLLPSYYESSDMRIAMKEGVAGLYIHKVLGIPEHLTIRESYSNPVSLYRELSRKISTREARTVLQMAGNMPEDCEDIDDEGAPYTD